MVATSSGTCCVRSPSIARRSSSAMSPCFVTAGALTALVLSLSLALVQLASALPAPVWGPLFLAGGSGRNIRNLPCVSRRTGETGMCMFAYTCMKANGTHLGTCIDRFYFGSCCRVDPAALDSLLPPAETLGENHIEGTSGSHSVLDFVNIVGPITSSSTSTTTTSTLKPPTPSTFSTTRTTTPSPPPTTQVPFLLSTFQSVQESSAATEKPTRTETETITQVPSSTRPSTLPPKPTTPTPINKPVSTYPSTQKPPKPPSNKPKPTKPASTTKRPSTTTRKPPSTTKKPVSTTRKSPSSFKPQTTTPRTPKPTRATTTTSSTTLRPLSTLPTNLNVSINEVEPTIHTSTEPPPSLVTWSWVTETEGNKTTYLTTSKPSVFPSTLKPSTYPSATKPSSFNTPTRPSTNAPPTKPSFVPTKPSSFAPTTKPTTQPTTAAPTTASTTSAPTTSPTTSSTTVTYTKPSPATSTTAAPIETSPSAVSPTPSDGWVQLEISTHKQNISTASVVTKLPPLSSSSTTTSTSTAPETQTSGYPPSSSWTPSITSAETAATISSIISTLTNNATTVVMVPSITPSSPSSPSSAPSSSSSEYPTPSLSATLSMIATTTEIPPPSVSSQPPSVSSPPPYIPSQPPPISWSSTISSMTPTDGTTSPPWMMSSSSQSPVLTQTSPPPTAIESGLDVEQLNSLNMSSYKDVCGRRLFPESRIVGGEKASFGKWPWQISLRQWRTSMFLHKCGAALLNENWAITAAHCVDNVPPTHLMLRLGEHDLSTDSEPYGYKEHRVQLIASHPQFDSRTFEYDLAMLRFYEPVTFQPNILPVCVPDDSTNFVGQTAHVTGWGRIYEEGPLPSVLQEVSVPVINNSVCETMYHAAGYIEHIPNIFICAGWRKGGFDSCEGDSGGPMVIQRPSDGRWILAGVISWGIGCAEPNQPGVYTRISEFRDWINQIIQF